VPYSCLVTYALFKLLILFFFRFKVSHSTNCNDCAFVLVLGGDANSPILLNWLIFLRWVLIFCGIRWYLWKDFIFSLTFWSILNGPILLKVTLWVGYICRCLCWSLWSGSTSWWHCLFLWTSPRSLWAGSTSCWQSGSLWTGSTSVELDYIDIFVSLNRMVNSLIFVRWT
jgi:hypothetical protein